MLSRNRPVGEVSLQYQCDGGRTAASLNFLEGTEKTINSGQPIFVHHLITRQE
jgi:hypothetical protein